MTTMREVLDKVLSEFRQIPGLVEAEQWHLARLDFTDAPHEQPQALLGGQRAVYLFFRGDEWLRIGQTSQGPRFTSQHYGVNRTGSTLAKDVWENRSEIGFSGNKGDVGDWIKRNCGRANVLFPADWPESFARLLEAYLHYRLTPRFEGRRVSKSSAES